MTSHQSARFLHIRVKSIWMGFGSCGRTGAPALTYTRSSDRGQGGMLDGGKVRPLTQVIGGKNETD